MTVSPTAQVGRGEVEEARRLAGRLAAAQRGRLLAAAEVDLSH